MSSTASSRKPHVVGGKLKLKGSGGSSSGVKRSIPSSSISTSQERGATTSQAQEVEAPRESDKKAAKLATEEFLTPSQKRHQQRKIEKEREEAKKLSKTSFRDRVDIFNNKLAAMTEHNDIPRISAAGNG